MAQNAGGHDLLSILADVAEEEHDNNAAGLSGIRPPSALLPTLVLPNTTNIPAINGGTIPNAPKPFSFDFSSIIDQPPDPIPFTSAPSTLSQASNTNMDFTWLDQQIPPAPPAQPPIVQPLLAPFNKSLSLPPQFLATPTPSFSGNVRPAPGIQPIAVKTEETAFIPIPAPNLQPRPVLPLTNMSPQPSPKAGLATPAQEQLKQLMNKIPSDKHSVLFGLFAQLQSKAVTIDGFISRVRSLTEQTAASPLQSSPRPTLPLQPRPPISSLSSTSITSDDSGVVTKIESPSLPHASLKRPAEGIGSPPDPKRSKVEPMMTRRMSAQLAGPPLSMSSPVPVPGNEPSGQGAPLRLPIAPAPSTMQAKGKAPAETDVDKLDVASMMDVTNYGGVDLREEEESFGMINTANLPPSNPLGVDRSKLQDFLNLTRLKRIVETKGRKHGIRTIDEDTLIYLALAARERATHLLEKMVTASKHRVGILLDQLLDPTTSPAPTTFNISVSNDVRRMIQMTEFMEREEDNRERVRLHPDGSGRSALETARAAALAAQAAGTAHPDAAIMTPLMMMPATTSGFETSGFEGAESLQAAAATGLGGVRGMETVVQADVAAAVAASVAAGDVVKPSKKKKAKKGAVDLTTEAIKARQVNTTALLAAGGAKAIKSWMIPGGGAVGAVVPGKKKKKGGGGGDGEVKAAKSGGAGVGVGPSGPVDPKVLEEEAQLAKLAKVGVYKDDTGREVRVLRPMTVREMTRVTLRDALFSLESEQQMSSSPLLYKWFGKIN